MKLGITVFVGLTIGALLAQEFRDDELKLKNSLSLFFTHEHDIEHGCDRLFSKYGSNSNLFVRISKQIYEQSKAVLVRSRALTTISQYGTCDDIGYLMSCATNHVYWSDIVLGVLYLDTPSNWVMRTQQLMAVERPGVSEQEMDYENATLVRRLLTSSVSRNLPSSDRQAIRDFAYSFTSNLWHQAWSLDDILQVDPTYEKSRRRKAMLQYQLSQLSQETNSCVKGYVSGELSKLQRLDDSELND